MALEPRPDHCCPICVKTYADPRILSCLHTFCLECIEQLFDDDGNKVVCPLCRFSTHLPDGEVSSLHWNIRLNDKALRNNIVENIMSPSAPSCDSCEGKAIAYCTTESCEGFMCANCYGSHKQKIKKTRSHEVINIAETQKEGTKRVTELLERIYPCPTKCNEHGMKLDFHCNECFKPVCSECVVVHQHRHNTCKIDDKIDEIKEEILTDVVTFPTVLDNVRDVVKEINLTKQAVEQCKEDVCSKITNCFDELAELLHQRKEVLINKTISIVEAKMAQLDEQLEILTKFSHDTTHCQTLATTACGDYTNVQLLSVTKPIKDRATFIQEELRTMPLDLCETADIILEGLNNNSSKLKSMIEICGNVSDNSPCASKVMMIIPRYQVALNTEMKVKVIAINSCGQRIVDGGSHVKSKLKCNNETVPCDVNDCGDGTYTVTVRSANEGKHKLFVSINGQDVDNSPFSIRVLPIHDHTSFGISLATMVQIKKPNAIAFSNNRMFISSESDKLIQVYNSTGDEKISTIGFQQLGMPCGMDICSSNEHNIINIADCKLHKIIQFSTSTNECLGSFFEKGSHTTQLMEPSDVKISPNGKIYISDTGNQRIQIFNKDKTLFGVINNFSSTEFYPNGMCFDLSGNVHIAGGALKKVNVFSPNKELIREYDCDIVATNIAIDAAGFSHVVGGSSLVVISPTGECVRQVDGFGLLTGVGISPNGSVWVVDNQNKIVKLAMDFLHYVED